MSTLRANHLYMSDAINTPVSFENPDNGMRYLRLHDQRAYELSFHCGTCAFLFERLEGANDTVDIGVLDSQLREGLASLDPCGRSFQTSSAPNACSRDSRCRSSRR